MSALGVAAVTGWTLGSVDSAPSDSAPQARTAAAEAPIEIQRTGQVVAVSENALTTVTPEGHTTTFRLTPDTNRITGGFEPSETVVVVGVVVVIMLADYESPSEAQEPPQGRIF